MSADLPPPCVSFGPVQSLIYLRAGDYFTADQMRAYATEAIAAQAAEMEALRAKVAEWEKLRDPVTLHVSLLRGFPARLSRAVFLHLAGDEEPKF